MSDLPPPPSWDRPRVPPPPPPAGAAGRTAPPVVPPIGPPRSSEYGYAVPLTPGAGARPIAGFATAASVLLAVATAVSVLAATALWHRAGLVDQALDGDFSAAFDLGAADDRVQVGILVWIASLVATGAVFITWQWRHAKNAQVLGGHLELGPGWAIGGWFVPIGNYVVPIIQLHQSARASGKVPPVLYAWAVAYMGASALFVFTTGLGSDEVDSSFAANDRWGAIGFFAYAVAGVLAIAVVRLLTRNQERALAALQPPTPPA